MTHGAEQQGWAGNALCVMNSLCHKELLSWRDCLASTGEDKFSKCKSTKQAIERCIRNTTKAVLEEAL